MGRKVKIHPPERLKDSHKLDEFDCGIHSMNHWIKKVARKKAMKNNTAAVFVVRAGSRVIGYYATAMGAVPLVSAGKLGQDAPNQVPVFILARMAVDKNFQGRGIGASMVQDALKRALRVSKHAGMRAVVVHTLSDDLTAYYSELGFQQLEPDGSTMFITTETIESAL